MDPISLSFHGGLKWGGSQNMAPNPILMVLVDLDVLQIVGYHYFDHHQRVRLGFFMASFPNQAVTIIKRGLKILSL